MLHALSHLPVSELILAGFITACGLLCALAEWRPGKRRSEDEEPPDAGDGDDRDDVLIAA